VTDREVVLSSMHKKLNENTQNANKKQRKHFKTYINKIIICIEECVQINNNKEEDKGR
jgi:hypothetical protein